MTTAATVVGHFPLVVATGPGAGARNSIGIMLVSGMIVGTLFTLWVVPSIYMLVARERAAAVSPEGFEVEIETHLSQSRPSAVEQSVAAGDTLRMKTRLIITTLLVGAACGLYGWPELPQTCRQAARGLSRQR